MNITVVGRGNVGGGLARRWQSAGHQVTALGRDGGDASGADVVVVAVPGHAVAQALATVSGLSGQVTVDATNLYTERDETFPSLAHQIKSIVGGPTAKAFSTIFAGAYDQVAAQEVPPSSLYAAEPEAREVTERLIRDAGFEPVSVGDLAPGARLLEDGAPLLGAVARQIGPFFYRYERLATS